MPSSGTFISDLRAEVMAQEYFTEMPELSRATEDLGIFMDSVAGPLLDYLLGCLDIKKANLVDREELAMAVITQHGLALIEIMKALNIK